MSHSKYKPQQFNYLVGLKCLDLEYGSSLPWNICRKQCLLTLQVIHTIFFLSAHHF